jgi:hypothetical protein
MGVAMTMGLEDSYHEAIDTTRDVLIMYPSVTWAQSAACVLLRTDRRHVVGTPCVQEAHRRDAERYRQSWEVRFDALDEVAEELKQKEKIDGRKRKK